MTTEDEAGAGLVRRVAILLVDDEESVLFAMHAYLSGRGYDAGCAADGETATRLLDQGRWACVVTDLHLTASREWGGFEIARRARAGGASVLLLTAHRSPEVDVEAERIGIARVVQKPVSLHELERMVAEETGGER